MDFDQIGHFLFETYEGIGLSILVCLLLCVVLSIVMEARTRKKFRDREREEGDITLFDSDEEE